MSTAVNPRGRRLSAWPWAISAVVITAALAIVSPLLAIAALAPCIVAVVVVLHRSDGTALGTRLTAVTVAALAVEIVYWIVALTQRGS